VTGAQILRTLAFLALVAAFCVLAVVWVLGQLAGRTPRELAVRSTPFVGGAAVVVVVALLHGPLVEPTLEFVAESLPGAFETAADDWSQSLLYFFGSFTLGLAFAAGLVGLTAGLSLALALAATAGSLPDRVTGPALAATGLFVATAFGAPAGVWPPLAVGGIVAAFVVWDAGEYGVRLGREVGAVHARRPVVVHLAATLAVGAVLAGAVALAPAVAGFVPVLGGPALPFAFVAVLLGLSLTVAALR
jgi:hypothetical protein